MKNNNQKAAPVLRREFYRSPLNAEAALQRTDLPWWASPVVIVLITLVLSALDAVVLYGILDTAMLQSRNVQILVSFGIAVLLNIFPLAIAWFYHQYSYGIARNAKQKAIICGAFFAVLYIGTVILRFAYMDTYTDSGAATHIVNEASATVNQISGGDLGIKGFALAFLLAVEPLATSGLNYFLAFISTDPMRNRAHALRTRRIELKEEIKDLEATQAGMRKDKQKLIDMDELRFLAACEMAQTRCDNLKARARFLLAEHLRNSQSISHLSEEAVDIVEKNNSSASFDLQTVQSAETA